MCIDPELNQFVLTQQAFSEFRRYIVKKFDAHTGTLRWSGIHIGAREIDAMCQYADWEHVDKAWNIFHTRITLDPLWNSVIMDAVLDLCRFPPKQPKILTSGSVGYRYLFFLGLDELDALYYTCHTTRRAILANRTTLMMRTEKARKIRTWLQVYYGKTYTRFSTVPSWTTFGRDKRNAQESRRNQWKFLLGHAIVIVDDEDDNKNSSFDELPTFDHKLSHV